MKPRNKQAIDDARIYSSEIIGDDPLARLKSWEKLAVSHMRGAGGHGFIIRNVDGPAGSVATRAAHTLPQWLAWMDYLERKRVPHLFLISWGVATMPAEWPWLFDRPEADATDHWQRIAQNVLAKRADELSRRKAEPRAKLQPMYWRQPEAKPYSETPEEAFKRRLKEYVAAPVQISSKLKEILG
jgi:hypothetical protein